GLNAVKYQFNEPVKRHLLPKIGGVDLAQLKIEIRQKKWTIPYAVRAVGPKDPCASYFATR
ncbi:hypothetical protein, partial [Serratia marcescens]|uniref:hypothetical protein n=1 Tax=Serratia marcescens TaxID=615 RepID=UPI001C8B7D8D